MVAGWRRCSNVYHALPNFQFNFDRARRRAPPPAGVAVYLHFLQEFSIAGCFVVRAGLVRRRAPLADNGCTRALAFVHCFAGPDPDSKYYVGPDSKYIVHCTAYRADPGLVCGASLHYAYL